MFPIPIISLIYILAPEIKNYVQIYVLLFNIQIIYTVDEIIRIQSYISRDKKQTFFIYNGSSSEAVRKAARCNNLPVDLIIEVSVLDPYFYKSLTGDSDEISNLILGKECFIL